MIYLGIETHNNIDFLINSRGEYSIVIKIKLPLCHSYSNEEFESIQNTFSKAINELPIDIGLQRIDISFKDNNKDYQQKSTSLFERYEKLFFDEREVLNLESYFIFTKSVNFSKKRTYVNSISETYKKVIESFKKGIYDTNHYNSTEILKFNNSVIDFLSFLKTSFGKLDFIYSVLNKNEINLLINKYFNGNFNLKSPHVNDIIDNDDHIVSGDNIISILSISELPNTVWKFMNDGKYGGKQYPIPVSYMHDLYFNTSENIVVVTNIYTINQKKFIKDTEDKGRLFRNLSMGSRKNAIASEHLDNFLNHIVKNDDDKVVAFSQSYLIYNQKNNTQWQRSVEKIRSMLNDSYNIVVDTNSLKSLRKMISFSPGNMFDVASEEREYLLCREAVNFLNYESTDSNTHTKGISLYDRKSKKPLNLNIYDDEVKHFCILGPTGTGKSFTNNHLVRNFLDEGCDVVIGDLGRSYKKLCEMVGGDFIETSSTNPLKINPFKLFKKDHQTGEYSVNINENSDEIEFIVNLFITCWFGGDAKEATNDQRIYISNLIVDYIKMINNNGSANEPSFTDFYNSIPKIIENSSIYNVSESIFNIKSFLLVMQTFCIGGQYGFLFDTNEDTELSDKQFIVFEFESIKDNKTLFPITYFIITNLVKKKLLKRKNQKPFYFILDELHFLLGGEYGNTAPFLEYCIRTFRKWGGALGMSTQNITDLIKNPKIKDALLNNVYTYYFKKQLPEQKKTIQDTLIMSNHNINLLYSIADPYKEIFIYRYGFGKVYGIETSTYSYMTYTTSPKDKVILEKELLQHPLDVAIENITKNTLINK